MAKGKVCLCIDYYVSCVLCPYKYNCVLAGKPRKEIMKAKLVKKALKKEGKKDDGKK